MRRNLAVFRAIIARRIGFNHVAILTGINLIFFIERQWRLLRPRRLLPFIIYTESTQPFVLVQLFWQGSFVTRAAKFRRFVEITHYGFLVQIRAFENLVIADLSGHRVAIVIHHYSRNAHHITAKSCSWLQTLNGMTDRAGDAIFIEGTVYFGLGG